MSASGRADLGLSAQQMIEMLQLVPLPGEGGYYRETYRSVDRWPADILGERFSCRSRSAGTCIYYLLTPETYSALHQLCADEMYHFYRGHPVHLTLLDEGGQLRRITLGSQLEHGEQCQALVPARTWQGSRLAPGGQWALLGTSMAPGFEFADCQLAGADLLARFPAHAQQLAELLARRDDS